MTRTALTPAEQATYLAYSGLALPRYTSYPTVPHWSRQPAEDEFGRSLRASVANGTPVSLYVHVPFCRSLCSYCGCTKEIVPDEVRSRSDPAEAYLEGIGLELAHLRNAAGPLTLSGIHLGGGTPTFLTPGQLARLWELIRRHFSLQPNAELAAEIDPRSVAQGQLATLAKLGFNRMSLGVQDFEPEVQAKVRRLQPFALVQEVVTEARAIGVKSVNFDLIYGLPGQTRESMKRTLARVVELAPDRVAFYRLAVIPEMFKWQRTFVREDLPDGIAALELMLLAIASFESAGYAFVGFDHFARPGDALHEAAATGRVARSFQGLVPGHGRQATLGIGPSAISTLDDAFFQNAKTLKGWSGRIHAGLAPDRWHHRTPQDLARGTAIEKLLGGSPLRLAELQDRFGPTWDEAWQAARPKLERFTAEGLITSSKTEVALTEPLGRLLARVVAAAFDAQLPEAAWRPGDRAAGSRVG